MKLSSGQIMVKYYNKARFFAYTDGFPGICGLVDGTQIEIVAPTQDEPIFVCRKGYHSINTHIISDCKLRIMHINAQFPGSAHDSFIFRSTNIWETFENGNFDQNTYIHLVIAGIL